MICVILTDKQKYIFLYKIGSMKSILKEQEFLNIRKRNLYEVKVHRQNNQNRKT